MAFPLVGSALSAAGITVNTAPPITEFAYSRTWDPLPDPLWQPQASAVKANLATVQKTIIAARVWSGAATASQWPEWGQGWPRTRMVAD